MSNKGTHPGRPCTQFQELSRVSEEEGDLPDLLFHRIHPREILEGDGGAADTLHACRRNEMRWDELLKPNEKRLADFTKHPGSKDALPLFPPTIVCPGANLTHTYFRD